MNGRVKQRLKSRTKLLLLMAVWIALPMLAFAQTESSAKPDMSAKLPAYEVVSIRPCKSDDGMSMRITANRLSAKCVTLWGLVYNAFSVRPSDPIPGLPGWASETPFDVEAKMNDEMLAVLQKLPRQEQGEQRHLMLQSLLADRFKLKVHRETKERPIYALVVAKGGFKLKESPASEVNNPMSGWNPGRIEVRGGSIGNLAFGLSDVLGRVVVDKTGITGKFHITLEWAPDELQGTPDAGPSVFTAIQEQLGLKLESTKGPVEILVVDHVEMPSEN